MDLLIDEQSSPTNETVVEKCNRGFVELMGFSKQGTSIELRRGVTTTLYDLNGESSRGRKRKSRN